MNLFSTLCFTWFMIVFCISGLFINFLQLLVLPLYWIKRDWYHIIIPGLAYGIFSQFTWMGEWWGEMDFKLYVDDINELNYIGKESSIVISNHYSDIDWLTGWIFAERVGLIGRAKVISKSEVKYLPIIGWCWWFAEFGFLKRNWHEDKKNFTDLVNSMKRNNNHFMMLLMCEGTRRTEEKLLASQEYARKNNIVPLKHHLFPRTKGFSLMVEALHNKVPAIYDLEFGFPDIGSTNVQNIINRGKIEVLMHFKRVPMSELPKSFDELSNYVVEHYRAKDKLYEHFVKTKEFPGIRVPLPRRCFNLMLFAVWNVLVFIGAVLWFNHCVHLYGGNFVMAISSLFLIGVYSLFKFLQNYTQTKRGSKFGLKDK